MTELCEKIV